jgi:hypothetical protein
MTNPLKKYSQRPGTYVALPSSGRYYIDLPALTADGELEVRPMTASDEIRLKSPDGLMNSNSLYQVIEHVAPGIVNGKNIPTPDLDVIVIAMRIATYGKMMDVGARCAKCGHDEQYQIDLSSIIAGARKITAPDSVKVGDLTVNLRPHTSESNTMLSTYQIEVSRAARHFELASISDKPEHSKNLRDAIIRGGDLLFEILAKTIVNVETPDEDVITDETFIREWLKDLAAPDYQIIRDAVNELSQECVNRKMKFQCAKCEHKNEVEVSFDPANFFGSSSL